MKVTRALKFGALYAGGWELRGVGLNLTRRCDLSCSYCRIVDNSKEKARRELSVQQWQDVIGRFVGFRHGHFIFTGGEPTLYRGVDELVAWTSERALTSMISHAGHLDEARFERLRHLDFLCFSFDTLSTAAGVLQKDPSEKLGFLAEQAALHDIALSSIITITSANLDEIEPMVRKLDQHGIKAQLSLLHSDEGRWDFRGFTPHLEFRSEAEISGLQRLCERLVAMKRAGVSIAETDAFLRILPRHAAGEHEIDCPAADPFVTVDFDGRIKACHDTPASSVSALDFEDLGTMRRAVRATVKPGCNCVYDCYFEARGGALADARRLLGRVRRR